MPLLRSTLAVRCLYCLTPPFSPPWEAAIMLGAAVSSSYNSDNPIPDVSSILLAARLQFPFDWTPLQPSSCASPRSRLRLSHQSQHLTLDLHTRGVHLYPIARRFHPPCFSLCRLLQPLTHTHTSVFSEDDTRRTRITTFA
jgi:hypothetical protein